MPFTNTTTFTLSQPSAVLSCFSYNSSTGAYVAQTFSQTGFTGSNPYQGFWVFCSAPVTLTLNGNNSLQSSLQTALVSGWNLVGTPLGGDVAASALQFS